MLPRMKLVSIILLLALLFSFAPAGGAVGYVSAASACYHARFVSETISDGSSFAPGTAFEKTWTFRNDGTCEWNGISLVYDTGEKMNAPDSAPVSVIVAPNNTVKITVNLVAPSTPGTYTGYFKFKSSTGEKFGIGSAGTGAFWVKINVTSTSDGGAGYDFVAEASKATWTNSVGKVLTFPGTDGDAAGFVSTGLSWIYEDNSSLASSMLVSPDNVTNGYIQGLYKGIKIQTGDRFRALIGCQLASTGCYVRYRLMYQVGTDPFVTLLDFREKWEGRTYHAVVNLDRLAGKVVNFILEVSAYGPPTGDRALWGDAVITRSGGTPPPAACTDRGRFVSDLDVPDGKTIAPGQAFTKTWQIRNIGTCTWTTAYSMFFEREEKMGGTDPVAFPKSVAPGEVLEISVPLVAPNTAGTYTGYWKFKNSNGVPFGLVPFGFGKDNQKAFWVKIKVPGTGVVNPMPDLKVAFVYVEMQGRQGGACVNAYTPYEIRVNIKNEGNADASSFSVEVNGVSKTISLTAGQSIDVPFTDLPSSGVVKISVDPANKVLESNENNNTTEYTTLGTPTPPPLCTPVPTPTITNTPVPPTVTPKP